MLGAFLCARNWKRIFNDSHPLADLDGALKARALSQILPIVADSDSSLKRIALAIC